MWCKKGGFVFLMCSGGCGHVALAFAMEQVVAIDINQGNGGLAGAYLAPKKNIQFGVTTPAA